MSRGVPRHRPPVRVHRDDLALRHRGDLVAVQRVGPDVGLVHAEERGHLEPVPPVRETSLGPQDVKGRLHLVFACLGIALSLHGRRALHARALNLAVAASVFMNAIAAEPGWRNLAIWAMPAAYALASPGADGFLVQGVASSRWRLSSPASWTVRACWFIGLSGSGRGRACRRRRPPP
jgi:hypothetical protein